VGVSILTRSEFKDYWNNIKEGLGNADSPLWEAEREIFKGNYQWFVSKSITSYGNLEEYWQWCEVTLKGNITCYSASSEENQEWWGFTNKDDIVIWSLRWR
jgi:hypothetical protein